MSKAKKSAKKVVIKSVQQAISLAHAKPEAKRVLSVNGQMKTRGKELGRALNDLREKLGKTKGCKGWFSKFLVRHSINRRTAYYAIDAANGKKRSTAKKRASNTISRRTPFQEFIVQLKGFGNVHKAFDLVSRAWKNAYPNATPLSFLGEKKPVGSVRTANHQAATA
jgi:hypothetical protein